MIKKFTKIQKKDTVRIPQKYNATISLDILASHYAFMLAKFNTKSSLLNKNTKERRFFCFLHLYLSA